MLAAATQPLDGERDVAPHRGDRCGAGGASCGQCRGDDGDEGADREAPHDGLEVDGEAGSDVGAEEAA